MIIMTKKSSEKDFMVTSEDEEAVEKKLQDFVLPVREKEDIYQPVIYSSAEDNLIPPSPQTEKKEHNKEYIIFEVSSSYYDSSLKKIIDSFLGFFLVTIMFYFLDKQPLLIFFIYMVGMLLAIWAFKSERLFIVWGFIAGALFSMFIALLIFGMNS